MSLDTVLKIGKALRTSNNSLKFFKYVQPCPKDKKGNYPLCLSIKVNDDFSIDLNNVSIVPENKIDDLFYLSFKTSDSDSSVKYIYGDIFYEVTASVKKNQIESKENGNYRLPKSDKSTGSFGKGEKDFGSIINSNKELSLRNNLENNILELERIRIKMTDVIKTIEKILKYVSAVEYYFINKINVPFADFINRDEEELRNIVIKNNFGKLSRQVLDNLGILQIAEIDNLGRQKIFDMSNNRIFIHFDYNGMHWYDLKECFDAVFTKMTDDFTEKGHDDGFVLKKSLYNNLCSGTEDGDIQFPEFLLKNKFKSKSFSKDEVISLFYGTSYASKGKSIYKTDLKLIVLPFGENLSADDYVKFLENGNETLVTNSNEYDNSLFEFALQDNNDITRFDLIFCKKGSMSSPDSDLIEISGIEKSKLQNINDRISKIAHTIHKGRNEEIKTKKDLPPLSIEYSFLNILGNTEYNDRTKKLNIVKNPKYQSHLLKVLPQIYLDNYFNDDILLPSFIQNVERTIRLDDSKYFILKYDLKFLLSIQNHTNNKYMELTDSKCYKFGVKLGKMAKPLKNEIGSFQKSYVGMLTRRIATKDDCVEFVNDICQKLTMHDKVWSALFAEVYEDLTNISFVEYDKDKLAFGFFEGYFKYEYSDKRKDFQSRLEKILSDYEDNEDLSVEIDKLSLLINEMNNKH